MKSTQFYMLVFIFFKILQGPRSPPTIGRDEPDCSRGAEDAEKLGACRRDPVLCRRSRRSAGMGERRCQTGAEELAVASGEQQ